MSPEQLATQVAELYVDRAYHGGKQVPWTVAARLQRTGLYSFSAASPEIERACRPWLRAFVRSPAPLVSTPQSNCELFDVLGFLSVPSLDVARKASIGFHKIVAGLESRETLLPLVEAYQAASNGKSVPALMERAVDLEHALGVDWYWHRATLVVAAERKNSEGVQSELAWLLGRGIDESGLVSLLSRKFSAVTEALESTSLLSAEQLRVSFENFPWGEDVSRRAFEQLSDKQGLLDDWLKSRSPGLWFQAICEVLRGESRVSNALVWKRLEQLLSTDLDRSGRLALQLSLSRHIFLRLELSRPDIRRDFCAWSGSFLASALVDALGTGARSQLQFIRAELLRVQTVSEALGPHVAFSSIGLAMRSFGSLWIPALLASGETFGRSIPDIPKRLSLALQVPAIKLAVTAAGSEQGVSEEIDGPALGMIRQLPESWLLLRHSRRLKLVMAELESLKGRFGTKQLTCDRMRRPFGDENDEDAVIAIRMWAAQVERGEVSIEEACDLLFSRLWCDLIEPTVPDGELDSILFAVLRANWTGARRDIGSDLSHWAISQSVVLAPHFDRSRRYLIASILLAVRSGSISACERLTSTELTVELDLEKHGLIEFLESIDSDAPDWIRSRLRSVMSALRGWRLKSV